MQKVTASASSDTDMTGLALSTGAAEERNTHREPDQIHGERRAQQKSFVLRAYFEGTKNLACIQRDPSPPHITHAQ